MFIELKRKTGWDNAVSKKWILIGTKPLRPSKKERNRLVRPDNAYQ
jgi:hypothetical protein